LNLTIIGSGYVGLVSGTCFAEMGNHVVCLDVNEKKINNLKKGIVPIYEPGLEQLVKKNIAQNTLTFTSATDKALEKADIIFIAVGTPMGEDGSADLQYVLAVAKSIGKYIQKDIIVVNKSTVPVGTADKVSKVILDEFNNRGVNFQLDVVSNPEFLKEGAAINDFMKPDRVVIGADSDVALKK